MAANKEARYQQRLGARIARGNGDIQTFIHAHIVDTSHKLGAPVNFFNGKFELFNSLLL